MKKNVLGFLLITLGFSLTTGLLLQALTAFDEEEHHRKEAQRREPSLRQGFGGQGREAEGEKRRHEEERREEEKRRIKKEREDVCNRIKNYDEHQRCLKEVRGETKKEEQQKEECLDAECKKHAYDKQSLYEERVCVCQCTSSDVKSKRTSMMIPTICNSSRVMHAQCPYPGDTKGTCLDVPLSLYKEFQYEIERDKTERGYEHVCSCTNTATGRIRYYTKEREKHGCTAHETQGACYTKFNQLTRVL